MLVVCVVLLSALLTLLVFSWLNIQLSFGFIQLVVMFLVAAFVVKILCEVFKKHSTDKDDSDSDFTVEKFKNDYWTIFRFKLFKFTYILICFVVNFHFFFNLIAGKPFNWLFIMYAIILIILDILIYRTCYTVIQKDSKKSFLRTMYFESECALKAIILTGTIFGVLFSISFIVFVLIASAINSFDNFE